MISPVYHEEIPITDENIFIEIKDGESVLTYISINLFLKRMMEKDYELLNYEVLDFFLFQHHAFIEHWVLVSKVISIYQYAKQQKRKRIYLGILEGLVDFICKWMIYCFNDHIRSDKQIFKDFKKLFRDVYSDTNYREKPRLVKYLELFDEKRKNPNFDIIIEKEFNRQPKLNIYNIPMLPDNPLPYFDILEWSEVEVARQLTLIGHELFCKIEKKELVSCAWTKKNKREVAPNVIRLIDRFNVLYLWVIEEILSYDKKSIRCKVIEKFILLAVRLLEFRNYNDLVMLVYALNSGIIRLLEKTVNFINEKFKTQLKRLIELCSYEDNYANLRNHQEGRLDDGYFVVITRETVHYNKKANSSNTSSFILKKLSANSFNPFSKKDLSKINKTSSCSCVKDDFIGQVPYLGILLRDLAFVEEEFTYVRDNNLINIKKIEQKGNLISSFLSTQKSHYQFKSIHELNFLKAPCPLSQDDLYARVKLLGNCYLPRTEIFDAPAEKHWEDSF